MADQKCAHPTCECRVSKGGEFGDYCSEHCKHNAKLTELHCNCGHTACRVNH
jgi:hypothetical protein